MILPAGGGWPILGNCIVALKGFIEEVLYDYRLEFTGVTGRSAARHSHWLDPLWIAEGLAQISGFSQREELLEARRQLLLRTMRRVACAPVRESNMARSRIADLGAYGRYRLASGAGRATPLHVPIPTVAANR
jgi:hypothetical protein